MLTRNFSRRLRFASGVVLLAYVASHLINHALGLVSLAVAEAARLGFIAFWRSPPATAIFYAALLAHIGLALSALYQRHTLRMPPMEYLRLVLGFSIPFLLAGHFSATRAAYELFAQDDTYARAASGIWAKDAGGGQLLLILAA